MEKTSSEAKQIDNAASQDRVDDQSVVLRLTDEVRVGFQECLVNFTKAASKEREILEGRVSALELKIAHQQQVFEEEKQRLVLEASSMKEAQILKARKELQQELGVVALRAEITRLQNENEGLVRKLDTIEERYKNNDLHDKTIQAQNMKIDQLVGNLAELLENIHGLSSNAGQQPANIPSQVSSLPVPDRDGPLLQGTMATNGASAVKPVDGTLGALTYVMHPRGPGHTTLPRLGKMGYKRKRRIHIPTDSPEEIDDFNESVISVGERDRFEGLSKGTDGKRDSSGEEAEHPHKNRKTMVTVRNNVSAKASDAIVVTRQRRNGK